MEGLQREALPLLRLHVLPQLHQDQLAEGIHPITRIEGAALGFLPGAALLQERRLAEEPDALLDAPVLGVQADRHDQARQAHQRFCQLT